MAVAKAGKKLACLKITGFKNSNHHRYSLLIQYTILVDITHKITHTHTHTYTNFCNLSNTSQKYKLKGDESILIISFEII